MRTTCWKCSQKIEFCLCSEIHSVQTNAHFIFLVHPKEFKKEKLGTGRMTHSALINSSFWMGIDFTQDHRVNQILSDPQYQCFILWPGDDSLELAQVELAKDHQNKKVVIFILDGTWAFAKKMYRLSTNLHSIQKISITPTKPSEFIFKQQPEAICLSTVESIVYVLEGLEKNGFEKHQNWEVLLNPFRKMVKRQIEISQNPHRKSYRNTGGYKLDAIKERAQSGTRKRKLF